MESLLSSKNVLIMQYETHTQLKNQYVNISVGLLRLQQRQPILCKIKHIS